MTRTSAREVAAAVGDLADALDSLALGVSVTRHARTVEVRPPTGGAVRLAVAALASPRLSDVERLVGADRSPSMTPVLVADRLVPRLRERLSHAGWAWLDRRGHLRLVTGSLVVDADVPPVTDGSPAPSRAPLDTVVGLAVATAVLVADDEAKSVRRLVAFTGHSLGAVHAALRGLRGTQLVDGDGRPLVPDLFWEVSARWRPRRVPLAAPPDGGPAVDGWVLCDTLAAAAYGAPVVVRGDYPPDLYVPDDRAVRVCRQRFGDPLSHDVRRASVALAPVSWAHARANRVDGVPWPVVHPVVAALDLSTDRARGQEILEAWQPPSPYRRVW